MITSSCVYFVRSWACGFEYLPHTAAFRSANNFNQPIGDWDVAKVTTLSSSECGSPPHTAQQVQQQHMLSYFVPCFLFFFLRPTDSHTPPLLLALLRCDPLCLFLCFLFDHFFSCFFLSFLGSWVRISPPICSIPASQQLQPAHRGLGRGQCDHFENQ